MHEPRRCYLRIRRDTEPQSDLVRDLELPSVGSIRGLLGISQTVAIVVLDEIKGPGSLPREAERGSGGQPAAFSVANSTHPSTAIQTVEETVVYIKFNMEPQNATTIQACRGFSQKQTQKAGLSVICVIDFRSHRQSN